MGREWSTGVPIGEAALPVPSDLTSRVIYQPRLLTYGVVIGMKIPFTSANPPTSPRKQQSFSIGGRVLFTYFRFQSGFSVSKEASKTV